MPCKDWALLVLSPAWLTDSYVWQGQAWRVELSQASSAVQSSTANGCCAYCEPHMVCCLVAACKLSCWQILMLPGVVRGLCLGICRCTTPLDESCSGCAKLGCSCCNFPPHCMLCCFPDIVEQWCLQLLQVLPSLAWTC